MIGLVGSQSRATAAEPREADEIVVYHDIPYREGGSRSWNLDLALRKDARGKVRPGIVVIHGGGWLEGDKSSFASREQGTPGNIVDFAALGFVAAAINYRLSGEAPFPAALEDCKNAVRWLRAHSKEYHLDPDHIGAYGNSAGGHLAMLLGMVDRDEHLEGDGPYQDQSSRVQASASDSGPIDLVAQHKQGTLRVVCEKFMGGPPEAERLAAYLRASPANQIAVRTPPILLIYGVTDNQVPVETADRFALALGRAGLKDVSYYRLAAVDHCPHSLVRVPYLRSVVNDFFRRTLMSEGVARIGTKDEAGRAATRSDLAKQIAELRRMGGVVFEREGTVVEVNLNRTRVQDDDLGRLADFTKMTDLSLEETSIGDDGLRRLATLKDVIWLNLYRTRVGDAGLFHLKGLIKLERLPLGETKVSDAGLQHLAGMSHLAYLGLRGDRITDEGLRQIQRLTSLTGLNLGQTELTDRGLAHLRTLVRLRQLWLNDTQITDAAVKGLAGLDALEDLYVFRTDMTIEGIKEFKRLRLGCRIYFHSDQVPD
jgi:acetyl esterase/lipase